jgi:carbamoyl-phosphate synthase small subunit
MRKRALVVLADGSWYTGTAFGADTDGIGEAVFNTSMSGYQEILTDPSYRGQLVTMTAPHIGNYGVNPFDVESDRVQVAGFIVRDVSTRASNFRATSTLDAYLQEAGVPAISDVDTRALTRRIRDGGATMGAIVHDVGPEDVPAIVARIHASPAYDEIDFVAHVSTSRPVRVSLENTGDPFTPYRVVRTAWEEGTPRDSGQRRVVVLDFGVKDSILRNLAARGFEVILVPWDTDADMIRSLRPDGLMLSNGPGDPARMDGPVETIRAILGEVPVFGICLGHQLLGRALGASTYKLVFGHRGPNQPVLDVRTGRVEITAQNHGYAVVLEELPASVTVTHRNLNDQIVEGIEAFSLFAFSVQHHPEAGPGPRDSLPMFPRFAESIDRWLASR